MDFDAGDIYMTKFLYLQVKVMYPPNSPRKSKMNKNKGSTLKEQMDLEDCTNRDPIGHLTAMSRIFRNYFGKSPELKLV